MSDTERDCWELQKLCEWLASRAPQDLARDLQTLEKARNTLNRVIGLARGEVKDAA